MQKYIGLAVGLAFAAYWIYKNIRRVKATEIKSIPTGVSRWSYLIVGLFFLISPFILTIATERLITEIRHQMTWQSSTGFITEHVADGHRKGRTAYRSRFHFQTTAETGQVDREVLNQENSITPPAISSPIKVLYNPSNPDEAKIDNWIERWLVGTVLILVGVFLLFFAIMAALQIMKLQSLQNLSRGNSSLAGAGEGRLQSVKKNFFLSLRHADSWRLIVEYTDLAGRKYVAQSEPIWEYHPDGWAKKEIPVPLTIDRADSSRAWVQVELYFQRCRS